MTSAPVNTVDLSLDLVEDLAREAGDIALGYFRNGPEVWSKGDSSPVSEADLAVDSFLKRTLLSNHPGYGWISEESASGPDRIAEGPVFVVDPIDGTRAFIKGEEEWAISIGIVHQSRPIAGILFCPALDTLYRVQKGEGAERDGEALSVSNRDTLHGARAAGPRTLLNDKEFFDLSLDLQPSIASLAYRLALVAEGRLDFALAKGSAHDWDLAAADLLVQEAGGRLTGSDGKDIQYNQGTLAHPALVCSPAGHHADLCDRVAAIVA